MLAPSPQPMGSSFCFQGPRGLSTTERHNERGIVRLILSSSPQTRLFGLHSLTCATYRGFDSGEGA